MAVKRVFKVGEAAYFCDSCGKTWQGSIRTPKNCFAGTCKTGLKDIDEYLKEQRIKAGEEGVLFTPTGRVPIPPPIQSPPIGGAYRGWSSGEVRRQEATYVKSNLTVHPPEASVRHMKQAQLMADKAAEQRAWQDKTTNRRVWKMLNELRNLNTDRMDLDQAIALSAYGRQLESEFASLESPTPEWLTSNLKQLRREIADRMRDELTRRLTEAKSRREALTPAEEKRAALDKEIEALSAKLGK